jgi:hypothetical protein
MAEAEAAIRETQRVEQRKRCLPALVVLLLSLNLPLFRNLSVPDVYKLLVNAFRDIDSSDPLDDNVTDEAIVKARRRLGFQPLESLFRRGCERRGEPAPSFHNFKLWAMDGSRFNVPDSAENEVGFGRPGASRGETAFPQMLAVTLVDVVSHAVADILFSGCRGSEKLMAIQILRTLGPDDLTLLDRGFASFDLLKTALDAQTQVVVRISDNWKPTIIRRFGDGDYLVRIRGRVDLPLAQQTARKKTQPCELVLRMICYTADNGGTIRLLTTLRNHQDTSAQELAELYNLRWECELVYDELKNHLAVVNHGVSQLVFRSKKPATVMQEAYALFHTYNTIREMMCHAARMARCSPLQLSLAGTLNVIKLSMPTILGAPAEAREALIKRLYKDMARCRLLRTRRPRRYPRKVKIKMSAFQVKRSRDKQSYHKPKIRLIDLYSPNEKSA